MTLSLLFLGVALLHAILLSLALRLNAGLAEWLVRLLLLGLLLDNTILGMSGAVFDWTGYYPLGGLRYVLHAIVLPPMVLAGIEILRRAGVAWAGTRLSRYAGLAFALAAILYGLLTEVAGLEMKVATLWEHRRYVSVDSMPPVATILTNFIVIILAAVLWRRSGWPWLFAGALFIFVVNAALGAREFGIVAGNLAEVVFALTWVATLYRFRPDRH